MQFSALRIALLLWALLGMHAALGADAPPTPAAVTPAADASSTPATAPIAPAATVVPAAPQNAIEPDHFDLSRPEIRSFIDQLVAQGLDRNQLTAVLSAAEPQGRIIDAMTRPAEKTLQWWEIARAC